jgi:signal transduction protein with GAF and PtsI domain
MDVLTPKQEAFCLRFIELGRGPAAYEAAYGRKPETSDATLASRASILLANPAIQARLAELRADAADKASLTLADHLESLREMRDEALADRKFAAAIQAEIARGKAAGLYVDKVESTHRLANLSDEELRARAAALAAKLGLA